METNFGPGALDQRRPRRRSRLEPILLFAFILCLLIGGGALAAMLWLNSSEDLRAAGPLSQSVPASEIVPQLALRQLAGDPPIPLAYQALEAGELETASAILSFDPQLKGRERSSLYFRLARQTADRGLVHRSQPLYETMRTIAVLDPELSATERLQLLQRSAEGLLANNQPTNALISAQQAQRVAAQTPDILPAQRNRFFESLRPFADEIEDELFQRQVSEFERNPYVDIRGVELPIKLDTLGKPLPPSPEIDAAIANRQQAALQLVEQLTRDPRAFATAQTFQLPAQQSLANALMAEDSAKTVFFNSASAMGSTLSLQQQLTLLEERQGWLALKLRIATRGFGLPLVPQWEEQLGSIQEQLAGVTQNIGPVIEALMNVEPTAKSKAALRIEKWRRLALLTEFGLYPGSRAEDYEIELRLAQDEARAQGIPPALPIIVDPSSTVASYRFGDPMGQ